MKENTPVFGNGSPSDIERIESNPKVHRILAKEDSSHWMNPNVCVGDTVFCQITESDIEEFNLHVVNQNVKVGDLMPAIIVRLFNGYENANMVVFVDCGHSSGTIQVFSREFLGRISHGG